jgi:hypothetical protein
LRLPAGVTTIGANAFYGCTNLTAITLPSTLTTIGGSAFYNCTNLATVTCEATMPPTLGATVFPNATTQIKVPADSVTAYQAATNWSGYASRISAID